MNAGEGEQGHILGTFRYNKQEKTGPSAEGMETFTTTWQANCVSTNGHGQTASNSLNQSYGAW